MFISSSFVPTYNIGYILSYTTYIVYTKNVQLNKQSKKRSLKVPREILETECTASPE